MILFICSLSLLLLMAIPLGYRMCEYLFFHHCYSNMFLHSCYSGLYRYHAIGRWCYSIADFGYLDNPVEKNALRIWDLIISIIIPCNVYDLYETKFPDIRQ